MSKQIVKAKEYWHVIDDMLHRMSPIAPFLVEFLGTFFLCFTITVISGYSEALSTQSLLGPLSIGFALMVAIFMGGHVSGAHYNPAVTLGVLISGRSKIELLPAVIYWLVQIAASFVASFVAWYCSGSAAGPSIGPQYSQGQAFVCELLWTFFLVSVVLNVATTKSQEGNSFFGHAIGFVVASGAVAFGPISGGVFNPAVGTGPVIVNALADLNKTGGKSFWENTNYMWIYWLAPILGGIFASLIFRITSFQTEYRGSAGGMRASDPLLDEYQVAS